MHVDQPIRVLMAMDRLGGFSPPISHHQTRRTIGRREPAVTFTQSSRAANFSACLVIPTSRSPRCGS